MKVNAPREWLELLVARLRREPAVVRVLVAQTRGSTPREAGACMLVDAAGACGTIGGGQLEWDAIAAARELLATAVPAARLITRVLGVDLGQCCGGVVDVWLECFTVADIPLLVSALEAARRAPAVLVSHATAAGVERHVAEADVAALAVGVRVVQDSGGELRCSERLDDGRPAVWLFGAGHVGQALARILVELPLRLTWIDSREQQFPPGFQGARLLQAEHPQELVAGAPDGTYCVIMTHSHPLDYVLCRASLPCRQVVWTGLIGSASKAARFRARLRRDGLGADALARLACPIGVEGIDSKWPAAIAVSVAAQLLQQFSGATAVLTPAVRSAAQPAAGCVAGECDRCGAGATPGAVHLS